MPKFQINFKSKRSQARTGVLTLAHGMVETPVFMPVGTVGVVKTMLPDELEQAGAEIILANTYHLYLRPGDKLIAKFGGLNNFIRWKKPILTDSGGYQVFSLGEGIRNLTKSKLKKSKISDLGVIFYSHLDGTEHLMTPEKSIQVQKNLGSDLMMALDDCPPANASYQRVKQAVLRTQKWYQRCLNEHNKSHGGSLVPICQGGRFADLRRMSCEFLNATDAKILAVGGVSVGESKRDIYRVMEICGRQLDEKRPHYVMGIGYPEDMIAAIMRGMDMFDCVLPTRLARHGIIWKKSKSTKAVKLAVGYGYEQIDISKSAYRSQRAIIDKYCQCLACRNQFSLAYLSHLIKEREPLGIHLLSDHNLNFVFNLINDARLAIKNNSL